LKDSQNPEITGVFTSFKDACSSLQGDLSKTLVVAAAHDEYTLEAVYAAANEFHIKYLLVGKREKIRAISSELGNAPAAEGIIDGDDDEDCARKAVGIIRENGGDVLMKGLLETSILLKAVLDKENGIRDSSVMSHLAMLEVPNYHKVVTVTDGGMIANPTLEQKAAIVRNAVAFYRQLGFRRPKIVALCASETVSERMPETIDASRLQAMCERGELGDCLLEGPLSFDLAVSPESAKKKDFRSAVTGDADILLVPGIATGNIFCKGLIYWAGAKMAGCVVGAKSPIVVVSRGATPEEKLNSIMLCLATQQEQGVQAV